MANKSRRKTLPILVLTALSLASACASETSSVPERSVTYVGPNVTNVFHISTSLGRGTAYDHGEIAVFERFETYEEFSERVNILLDVHGRLNEVEGALEKIEDYFRYSDDYIFIVWQFFWTGFEERTYSFEDDVLTAHAYFDCLVEDKIYFPFDAVTVPREAVNNIMAVQGKSNLHNICDFDSADD